MRNLEYSKLIYFLAAFSSYELKEFRKYLESPIFNRKEEPVRLFDYIKKYCLKTVIKDIDEKKATSFIWPGEKVPTGRLDKLKNLMLDLCLDYMSFRSWNESPARKSVALVQELNRIDDRSYFAQYHRKALDTLKKKMDRTLEFYELYRELKNQNLIYELKGEDPTDVDIFESAEHAIEINITTLALQWAFLTENRNRTRGEAGIAPWMESLIDSLKPEDLRGGILASFYYYLYMTSRDPENNENFDQLKALVLTEAEKLDPMGARDIYTGTINAFLQRRRSTGVGTLEEIFELYQSMVEVVARGKKWGLTQWNFKNIVYLGSILGEFEWVEKFLDEDADLLTDPEADREIVLTYNRGIFKFYQGDHDEAQRCFNQILPVTKSLVYELDCRAYLLMCAFETGDSMGMESQVHSFRMFLTRNKRISEIQRERYSGFIRLYRNLLATPPQDDVRLQKLKTDIGELRFNAGKTWLMRKLETGI